MQVNQWRSVRLFIIIRHFYMEKRCTEEKHKIDPITTTMSITEVKNRWNVEIRKEY